MHHSTKVPSRIVLILLLVLARNAVGQVPRENATNPTLISLVRSSEKEPEQMESHRYVTGLPEPIAMEPLTRMRINVSTTDMSENIMQITLRDLFQTDYLELLSVLFSNCSWYLFSLNFYNFLAQS